MNIILFISETAIIIFIGIVIIFGLLEKKNLFELFVQGCYDGIKVIWELFPTLLALLVAVGMFSCSGIIDNLGELLYPLFKIFNISKELIPLVLLRPISGSTTTAIATDIMKKCGVDSNIGLIASTIMGSTETTIYVIALYTSKIKIKSIKEVLIIGLIADFVGICISVLVYSL